jgi:hypothetical protein
MTQVQVLQQHKEQEKTRQGSQGQLQKLQTPYPTMLKVMTDEETKEYHLKKFANWGKKYEEEMNAPLVYRVDGKVYRNGKLFYETPTEADGEWAERKMKAAAMSWMAFNE